jgi:hypothetical protein
MSHTRHEPVRARLERSMLVVPASQKRFFQKGLDSDADYV